MTTFQTIAENENNSTKCEDVSSKAQIKHSAKKDRETRKEILAFKERMRLLEESQRITQEMLDSIISL